MRRATFFVHALLAFALLPWCGCKHVCGDTPSDAVEYFTQLEGTHAAKIGWVGLVESGELDESQAFTAATIEVALDTATAATDDANAAIGCDQRYTIDGTLLITSEDGLLDESIPIAFTGNPAIGDFTGFADLTDYDFAGALELGPQWTGTQRLLHISFDGDGLRWGLLIAQDRLALDDEESASGFLLMIERPD